MCIYVAIVLTVQHFFFSGCKSINMCGQNQECDFFQIIINININILEYDYQ